MGFWSSARDFIGGLFGGDDDDGGGGDSFDDSPDYGSGPEDQFSWQLAGYVEAGDAFDGGYVNVEREGFTDWSFLPESDYVVVKVTAEGDSYYTTLAGPFDDYDDFYDAILDWWEQGS